MIKHTLICDKCNLQVNNLFKLSRTDISTKETDAGNYQICTDGISFYDTYKAWHLCQECVNLLEEFLNDKGE